MEIISPKDVCYKQSYKIVWKAIKVVKIFCVGEVESMSTKETDQNQLLEKMNEKIQTIAGNMERTQIADYIQLMNSPGRLITLNLISGIARGVGIAIGFTIFTATIVYLLKALGALDLPIIGDYIADIVRIVQIQLEGKY
jgi:hypothetical protein